ncbi:hypothetical protein IAD21_03888 [Abditibacteriota bacterium]|nr:hypothetical protein IAD21_03888 [Abditibacteriota bacterium]
MSTRWRHFFASVPHFALVLSVAFLTAVVTELLCLLIGNQEGNIFWQEFGKGELILGDRLEVWTSLALLLASPFLLRFCGGVRWRTIGAWLENHVVLVVVLSGLFYAMLMHGVGKDIAYSPDEACAILQARTFAALKTTPQVGPELARLVIPKNIQDDFVVFLEQSGRYTPTYWPGYSLILMPFALLGVEWLCNPVLTALSLFVLFHLVRRLTGSKEGGAWSLAFALSAPQVMLNSATYYSMPAHLLFNLLFCWLIVNNTRRAAFAAGLVGGFALILHNPAPHFSFAFPWIVWLAFKRRSHLFPLVAGYALICMPFAVGWSLHLQSFDAGRYLKAATSAGTSPAKSSNFAEVLSRLAYVVHFPGTYIWLSRVAGVCKFVIWAAPGAAGLALAGWLLARRERYRQKAIVQNQDPCALLHPAFENDYFWLFGLSVTFNFVLYLFFRYDQGHGWGYRYMHQNWMALAVLPAFFLVRATPQWKKLAALFCLCGLFVIMPIRILQMRALTDFLLERRPPSPPSAPTITFMREDDQRATFLRNDPFLRNSQWNLRFQSPAKNAAVAQRYLANAHQVEKGVWGEMWVGDSFVRSGSPVK